MSRPVTPPPSPSASAPAMGRMRVGLAVALGTAALLGVAALTRVRYAATPGAEALLRLSWRARGERLESCRRATAEELAALPAHMREETVCEGARVAPYALRVTVDGRVVADGQVPGSGARGDRPLYVLREFALAPGAHRVAVRFARVGPPGTRDRAEREEREHGEREDDDRREHDGPRERHARAVPPLLTLDTVVTAGARDVLLVTFAPELERLVLVTPAPATAASR